MLTIIQWKIFRFIEVIQEIIRCYRTKSNSNDIFAYLYFVFEDRHRLLEIPNSNVRSGETQWCIRYFGIESFENVYKQLFSESEQEMLDWQLLFRGINCFYRYRYSKMKWLWCFEMANLPISAQMIYSFMEFVCIFEFTKWFSKTIKRDGICDLESRFWINEHIVSNIPFLDLIWSAFKNEKYSVRWNCQRFLPELMSMTLNHLSRKSISCKWKYSSLFANIVALSLLT